MTANEKAKQLIQKFRTEIYSGVITTADGNPKRDAQRDDVARRTAIVCANEIISEIENDIELTGLTEYWKEVKKELENYKRIIW